jgi:hypothetical protein
MPRKIAMARSDIKVRSPFVLVTLALSLSPALLQASPKVRSSERVNPQSQTSVVLWQDPGNVHDKDILLGEGKRRDQETANRFTYVKEDMNGTSVKFDVRDDQGRKWRIKLGEEARPETVASRLLWALGYHANETYFEPTVRVSELRPLSGKRKKRAIGLIDADGTMHDAELKYYPEEEKKKGQWKWRQNPFWGTREFNGLRVIMAVMNNWDLKDENNSTFSEKAASKETQSSDEGDKATVYSVSDLGASFGTTGRVRDRAKAKGNLDSYLHSKFIRRITPTYVDFETPARESAVLAINPREFIARIRLRWIGRRIPRQDAKWAGELLARLSQDQIKDAFRAAGYSAPDVDGFSATINDRIAQLNAL